MIPIVKKVLATTRFEFVRSFTRQRIGILGVLVAFPPAMLLVVSLIEGSQYSILMTNVMVLFVGLLSLLLWASPNVHGELEARSWAYVTSRRQGRFCILFGKYLNAVLWGIIVGWTSITLCSIVIYFFDRQPNLHKTWLLFSIMVFVASPIYAAIFSLIGVIFSRRSMVFGAGYIIVGEMGFAWIPANINKVTGGFHLFSLSTYLFGWNWFPIPKQEFVTIYGSTSLVGSISFLIAIPIVCLVLAAFIVRWREYIHADESG